MDSLHMSLREHILSLQKLMFPRKNKQSKYVMRSMTVHATPRNKNKNDVPSCKLGLCFISNSWLQGQILISFDQGAMETRPSMFSKWLYGEEKARIFKVQKTYALHIACQPNLFSLPPGGCREGSLGAQEIKRKKCVCTCMCVHLYVCVCLSVSGGQSEQIDSPGKERWLGRNT